MKEIFDDFIWTKQKQIIPKEKHNVPGLGNVSHFNYSYASTPTPMHYHSDIIEIHCMVKGTRFTRIEQNGGIASYTSTGNQAMITFPFELHSNGDQPLAPCEFFAFQIIISDPSHMLGLNREYSKRLVKVLTTIEHRHTILEPPQQNYIKSAYTLISQLTPESIMFGLQYLNCFLLGLQNLEPVPSTQMRYVDDRIKYSIDFLTNNIHENLQLADLANASGYSLSRFKVKFRDEIGITPAEYITRQKIEKSKELLLTTNDSITEIAYSLGFSSSNYFCAVFKKIMDSTPTDFRRINLIG